MTSSERDTILARTSWGRWQAIARRARPIVLALLGLGLAAAGIMAVFGTENDAGAATLVTIGVLVVLFTAIGDRLESLRYGDLVLVLRRKANQAEARGDLGEADALRRAADSLDRRVTKVASSYAVVRQTMPVGPERTAAMERITAEAARDAHAADLDPQKVLGLLWTGSEGERIWALGVLLERPELATVRAVLEAVLRPEQMFDQLLALRLAEAYIALPTTRTWPRERVTKAVKAQISELGDDADSHDAAQRVLDLADRLTR